MLIPSKPGLIAFSGSPGHGRPATKNLSAVKEGRFPSLPVVPWVSSPLNVDTAENLRARWGNGSWCRPVAWSRVHAGG